MVRKVERVMPVKVARLVRIVGTVPSIDQSMGKEKGERRKAKGQRPKARGLRRMAKGEW
jgi:hypothetical protein